MGDILEDYRSFLINKAQVELDKYRCSPYTPIDSLNLLQKIDEHLALIEEFKATKREKA